jgi:Mn-dependent DtxR family transcriptional regulator
MPRNLEKEIDEIKEMLKGLGRDIAVIKGKDPIPVEEEDGRIRYEPREVMVISQLLRDYLENLKSKGEVKKGCIIHAGRVEFDKGHAEWINTDDFNVLTVPEERIIDFVTPFTSDQRLKLMKALIEERNGKTSSQLSKEMGLDSGPLYHHLRELSSAGFIKKEQRGRYKLSIKGTIALLTISHMAKVSDEFELSKSDEIPKEKTTAIKELEALSDIIDEMLKQSENDLIKISTVLERAEKEGIKREDTNRLMTEMKKKGAIHEPKLGYITPTRNSKP